MLFDMFFLLFLFLAAIRVNLFANNTPNEWYQYHANDINNSDFTSFSLALAYFRMNV